MDIKSHGKPGRVAPAGSKSIKGGLSRWIAAAGLAVLGFAGAETLLHVLHAGNTPARLLVIVPEGTADKNISLNAVIANSITRLFAPQTLASAVKALNLTADPQFAGANPEVVLAPAIRIGREGDAPVIAISADIDDKLLAAKVANSMAGFLTGATPAFAQPKLSPAYKQASAELEAFQQGEGANLEALKELVSAQQAGLQSLDLEVEAARTRLSASKNVQTASVLSGEFPAQLETSSLEALLSQFVEQKAVYQSLTQKLGPRHPQLKSAKKQVDKLVSDIQREAAAISSDAQSQVRMLLARRARQSEALATKQAELASLEGKRQQLEQRVAEAAKAPAIPAPSILDPRFRLIAPAKSDTASPQEALAYDLIGTAMGVLAGAFLILRRRTGPVRVEHVSAPSYVPVEAAEPVAPVQVFAPEQLGILEQIALLEKMWPATERSNKLPEAVNDEPAQLQMLYARQAFGKMNTLRDRAHKAASNEQHSSLEQALEEMNRLRAKVQWHAVEMERLRSASSGRR
jgi:hypothetical protein